LLGWVAAGEPCAVLGGCCRTWRHLFIVWVPGTRGKAARHAAWCSFRAIRVPIPARVLSAKAQVQAVS
jgi:hypothetical protein